MKSSSAVDQFPPKTHLPSKTHQRCWFGISLSLVVLVLTGCGGPTVQDFTKLKPGMPLTQVEQILGTGTEVFEADPELPGIYIPTPQERADAGSPNQRWIKWVIDGHYILVGVDDDEVFMVNRDKKVTALN